MAAPWRHHRLGLRLRRAFVRSDDALNTLGEVPRHAFIDVTLQA